MRTLMEEFIHKLFKKKNKILADDEVFTETKENKEEIYEKENKKVIEPNELYKGVIYEGILYWISGILICFWVSGLIFSLGGSMVHILLVLAIILLLVEIILGRKLT